MIKEYYLVKELCYVKQGLLFKNRARVFGNGLAFAEGKDWIRRRRIMTSMFHFEFF